MGERWRWLGRPWFLASVALLAVNDHLLKHRFPGWWTGKASDVAGVAVVATLASVVAGRRVGVALAAIGFVALKVVPGVAEAAVPLLGGRTRRDATDLVGLLVLVPLWSLLREPAGPPHRSDRIAWRNVAAAALPVLGATTAVLATTATSCAPEPAVTRLTTDGASFYAAVDDGWKAPSWARSTDGGFRWVASKPPPGVEDPTATRPRRDERPDDLVIGCSGATCYRLRNRTAIERSVAGRAGPWTLEHRVTEPQRAILQSGCGADARGMMRTAVASSDPERATVDFGAGGVLARQPDGRWVLRPVLAAAEPEVAVAGWWQLAAVATLVGGAALAIAVGRRSPERWLVGGAMVVGGLAYVALVDGSVARESIVVLGLVGVVLIAVAGVAWSAIGLGERLLRPPPPPPVAWWPPPPPPPPGAERPGSEGPGSSHDGGGRGI